MRAQDRELGREVALKLVWLPPGNRELAKRVLREARVTSRLQHPGVVRVFDHEVDTEAGLAWVVYELVEGVDLEARIQGRGPLSPAEVRRLGADLAHALAAVHEVGVVHRDVKPGNVLLRRDGSPVLCDFGLAADAEARSALTQPGWLLGTPAYLAPELLRMGELGPAADQYSLGATLWEALTGETAIPGRTMPEILTAAEAGTRRTAPRALVTRAPVLVAVLRRTMAPAPADRFPSCEVLAAALDASESEGAPNAESSPTLRRTVRIQPARAVSRPSRSPRPASLAIRGLGLAAALSITLVLTAGRGRPPPRTPLPEVPVLASPEPGSEALREPDARLRARFGELAALHFSGARASLETAHWYGGAEHGRAVRASLLKPELQPRLREVLDLALERAARQTPAEGRDDELRLMTLSLLHHLRRDLRGEYYDVRRNTLFGQESVRDWLQVEQALAMLRDEALRLARELTRRTDARPDAVAIAALVRTEFAELGDATDLQQQRREVAEALAKSIPLTTRVDLQVAALEVVQDLSHKGGVPCRELSEEIRDARALFPRLRSRPEEAERLRIEILGVFGRGIGHCGELLDGESKVWLQDVLEEWLARPAGSTRGAADAARQLAKDLRVADVEVGAALSLLEKLADGS
jgi:serine/threonine protein kinase